MGLVKTPTAQEGAEQEKQFEKVLNELNYYKGKAEALEEVIKLIVQKNGK